MLNQLQNRNSLDPGTSGAEDLLSNLNFNEENAFNNFQVARMLSDKPNFLEVASSVNPSDTEGIDLDIDEIENMLGSDFGRIQEAMQQV